MIDIRILRENPKIFYESCEKRGFGREIVDRVIDLDTSWRSMLKQVNEKKHLKNELSLKIADLAKKKEDSSEIRNDVKRINSEILTLEERMKALEKERELLLLQVPNVLHDTVPVCKGDENNKLVRYFGKAKVFSEDLEYFLSNSGNSSDYTVLSKRPESHVDLMEKLKIADVESAARISGSRFYFLKNRLLKLELALVNYAVDFLSERGFSMVEPPFMMNYDSLSRSTDIETFKDSIYKIEGDDLYMIATSEHPIAAMLKDQILEENDLPLRIGGVSTCFRREAGAHGKDTKGIFRVHQFTKVEQFVFCREEDSWDFHEEILQNAEQIYRSLRIPYRVVNICSGELSILNSKKYDIEGWFPSQGKFRELVSASNNTDFQARSLGIRYRSKDGNHVIHTLNSTAIATTRTLVAIMENFQREDGSGIDIPETLIPYTGFDSITS